MVANRQDAWTPDDDLLLAEVTLRHIREGGTQLHAFEEVAERLGRTSAACGFRWNSTVRKNYESAISLAKSQRQKLKNKKTNLNKNNKKEKEKLDDVIQTAEVEKIIDFDEIISFLKVQKNEYQELQKRYYSLESDLKRKEMELEVIKKENQKMKNEYSSAKSVNDDYLALVQIMERARKLAFLNTEEDKPIFKMDANGNLERVNK